MVASEGVDCDDVDGLGGMDDSFYKNYLKI